MRHSADDDLPLVRRAKGGDYSAFESLVARHQRQIYTLAVRIVGSRHDAEEVVQQTFLSVIEHLGEFREQAGFRTWLFRIATNHALALLRKRAVRRTVPFQEDPGDDDFADVPHPQFIARWSETPEQIASRRETRQIVDQALAEIDEKYRVVFVLRDIEGFSTKETAKLAGISESNAKVRLLRARLMLRERLTRRFGDEASRVLTGHDHAAGG